MPAPDRGRCALRDSFPAEGRGARSRIGCVYTIDQLFYGLGAQVTAKLGLDAAGMHGRGPHAVRLVPPVELDGEQDVGGLRAAIGPELSIGRVLEVRIVEVNVGEPMTRRGQVDQARAGLQQRDDAVN